MLDENYVEYTTVNKNDQNLVDEKYESQLIFDDLFGQEIEEELNFES